MFKRPIFAASFLVVAGLLMTPASAYQCPTDMARIDAALSRNPKLTATALAKVRQLRAQGQALHDSGKTRASHAAAVEKFSQAKRILGIQ
jgi:hypothetical protein